MTPLIVVAAGVVALIAAAGVLLSFGSRYRVGRLLAATPKVSVDEAVRLAAEGAPRYVRIDGRLDTAYDFPDEHERPLVYRRRRLQVRKRGQWRSLEDRLEAVPFEIREGLTSIAVDHEVLDQGLVVLPRESTGTAAEIPESLPADTPAATPARVRVEQLSSIEHAIVLGVPIQSTAGAMMTAGMGRPLVLTTLEIPEAMRILGGGRRRPIAVVSLFGTGLALVAIGLVWALLSALR